MGNYRITIYATNGVTVIPVYEILWAAVDIIDAHCKGRNLCNRFDKHAPVGIQFMVLVTENE